MASGAGTLSGRCRVNPTNNVRLDIHCLTQTNQSYATVFELQSPLSVDTAKNIKPQTPARYENGMYTSNSGHSANYSGRVFPGNLFIIKKCAIRKTI